MQNLRKYQIFLFFLLILFSSVSHALENEEGAVFVRVIDTGAGLATVTSMPGGHYMVYDAGHWYGKTETMEGISSVVPEGEEIDLLVLSHSDSDHIAAVPNILAKYTVKTIIRSGLERTPGTWVNANEAIKTAKESGTTVINLKHDILRPGSTFIFGETLVTFICGFYAPPDRWDIKGGKTGSEFRNAGSIVVRLTHNGKSILYTGDAVGRHIDDLPDTLIATEKFMVDNSDAIIIDSDVLIAPHHGADNGNSEAFISEVSPDYVIFSAGHMHEHPRGVAVQRYIDYGLEKEKMYRTDLKDNEGGKGMDPR